MMKFMIILLLKKNQLEYKFGNNFIVPIRSDGMINATGLDQGNNIDDRLRCHQHCGLN